MKLRLVCTWLALTSLAWASLVVGGAAPATKAEVRGASLATSRLETGRFLVARPGMVDANFARTVVLLLAYGDGGAFGVIVNRPTSTALSHVLPGLERLGERPDVVFRGGPVAADRMIFAFRAGTAPAGCAQVLPDVCATGSLEIVEAAFGEEHPLLEFRAFLGHAGWTTGQLEWEIEQERWYVVAGDSQRVFDSAPDDLWADLVRIAESPVA